MYEVLHAAAPDSNQLQGVQLHSSLITSAEELLQECDLF